MNHHGLRTGHRSAWALAALAVTLATGCSAAEDDPTIDPNFSDAITASRTVGNWSRLPDGLECLAGMQEFYPSRFDVSLPLAGPSWTGDCAPHGACHIWLDRRPDSSEWERIPNDGHHMPTTYDLIVYPPVGGDPWGHIAAVDHVEGGRIFVMDDNYVCHHCRSRQPHTVAWPAYGWYHLRRLGAAPAPAPTPAPSGSGSCFPSGLYCGGDRITGNANTLYRCNGSSAPTSLGRCTDGCEVRAGQNDTCNGRGGCVRGGLYCGGDKVSGEPDTLYRCTSGDQGTVVEHCSRGCAVNAGSDDSCR